MEISRFTWAIAQWEIHISRYVINDILGNAEAFSDLRIREMHGEKSLDMLIDFIKESVEEYRALHAVGRLLNVDELEEFVKGMIHDKDRVLKEARKRIDNA